MGGKKGETPTGLTRQSEDTQQGKYEVFLCSPRRMEPLGGNYSPVLKGKLINRELPLKWGWL